MKKLALIPSVFLFAAVANAESFEFKTSPSQTCYEKTDVERCYPSMQSLGLLKSEKVEITEQLRNFREYLVQKDQNPNLTIKPEKIESFGGAFVFTKADIDAILEDFAHLDIRNLAVDPTNLKSETIQVNQDGYAVIKFFASVFWKDRNGLNGTIDFVGDVRYRPSNINGVAQPNPSNLRITGNATTDRLALTQFLSIDEYADSHSGGILQALEKGARNLHFEQVGTRGKTIDAATRSLITEIAGPMILEQILVVPIVKSFAGAASDAINNALVNGIKNSLVAPPRN